MTDAPRARRLGAFLLPLLSLVACDQKDPNATGKAGSGDFYPLVDGASWRYEHKNLDGETWTEEVTLEAVDFEGEPAFLLADSPGPSGSNSESVLQKDGDAILRVHKEVLFDGSVSEAVDYDPGFIRFDAAWLEFEEGQEQSYGYERTQLDGNGVAMPTEMREHRYTLVNSDAVVEVPAGDFSGCLEIRRKRVRESGDIPGAGDDKTFWFCDGIGKVKEYEAATGKNEELLDCDVPGGACP
ncbi:MAG: hypothetical protein OEZ06_22340 [Myxococcales bacterium]|nr:hypothetical protein [Myxococcales bacterium]